MSRTMLESVVENHLVTMTKLAGGEVRKVSWIGRRGAPDRLVLRPGSAPVWVELKRPGLKPEPHQAREHERMRALGCRVLVIDTIEGVDALFAGNYR